MKMKSEGLNKPKWFDFALLVFLGALAIIVLFPFYYAIVISLVPQHVYISSSFLLYPKEITFIAYTYLIEDGQLLQGMLVTTFVTVFGVIYNMFLTVMCAYTLSKPFPGKKFVSYAIIFTMYFTGGLIPNYLLIKNLGLMDNVLAMILPTGITFMYMVVIRRHFETIPASIEESAKIDGANDITILFRIVLPLSLPILATFALYYGVDRWNEWWYGMLYIKSVAKQPLQLILRSIVQNASNIDSATSASGAQTFTESIKMACTVITMLPIMTLYPFLQKYFITGLTAGAVKE